MVLILSLFRRASNPQLQHQQLHRDHFLNGDRDGVLDRFPFPDEDVRDLLVHGDGDGSVGEEMETVFWLTESVGPPSL